MRNTCLGPALAITTALIACGCSDGGSACGDCDDGIPCTSDACDATSGRCVHTPDDSICGLGFVCDLLLGCTPAGPCEFNADCDDHNPCTIDVCEPGGCAHTFNNLPCDDGDACTAGDVCSGGACAGAAVTCDDGNQCTDDSCDAERGCVVEYNRAACDDGNPCTTDDACTGGACLGQLDDCDDGNQCTADTCDPASGCEHASNTLSCDDGDPCTEGDACSGGACAGAARQCFDDNPCTDDSCDPVLGCVFSDNMAPCDDGNPCTENDACAGGACVGGTNFCACTIDSDCAPFEDGDPCTGTLVCRNDECVVDPATVVVCDTSGDTGCARNTCDPADGLCRMVDEADGTPCSDGSACTVSDQCSGGVCTGDAVVCNDGNICTDDGCDPVGGCQYTPNSDPCDDGDPCTTDDTCNNGSCVGVAVVCDDGNPCTSDFCNPAGGCDSTFNSDPCDDGDPCTDGDTCAAGECRHGQEVCCDDDIDNDEDGAFDCDDAGCTDDPDCITYQVDWCRLNNPTAIDALQGSLVTVYGHLNIMGLTTRSSGNDPHADVLAQVGWGADGSEPSAGGWTWTPAVPNPFWDDAAEPGNDEYMGDLLVPPAAGSPYDFAFRFSADNGQTWTCCDSNAGAGSDGSQDGYQPANAGQMTSSEASFAVDWCRLEYPTAVDDVEGARVTVYGHLHVAGLTDQSGGNDPHADVLAQVGWGADGSEPSAGGWTWTPAVPNPFWDDAAEPGNDEYMGDLLVPPAAGSPYDFAFRFSADNGQTWTCCDSNAGAGSDGSQDGYQPANAGQMTARPGDCDDSNWDFEEAWSAGENPPDFLLSSVQLSADPETAEVGDGTQACRLTWTSQEDQTLQAGWLWNGVQTGVEYTLHAWLRDEDPAGQARLVLSFGGAVDAGPASADLPAFREYTHTAQTASAAPWLAGGLRLADEGGWDGDATLVVDDFDLTRHLAFAAGDGELESFGTTNPPSPVQWADSPQRIWAAINDQGVLYAATDPMPPGQTDMMLFAWVGEVDGSAFFYLPWGKTGQIAAPTAGGRVLALIQEEQNGYCEWRSNDGAGWIQVSIDCATGTVLEGQVDLAGLLGAAPADLPARLSLAAARINTGDGGTMWASSQTPPCQDCLDDCIDPDETLPVLRARLLVGRIK